MFHLGPFMAYETDSRLGQDLSDTFLLQKGGLIYNLNLPSRC